MQLRAWAMFLPCLFLHRTHSFSGTVKPLKPTFYTCIVCIFTFLPREFYYLFTEVHTEGSCPDKPVNFRTLIRFKGGGAMSDNECNTWGPLIWRVICILLQYVCTQEAETEIIQKKKTRRTQAEVGEAHECNVAGCLNWDKEYKKGNYMYQVMLIYLTMFFFRLLHPPKVVFENATLSRTTHDILRH